MQNLVSAAIRRKTGVAAAVLMAGGLAGTVLLTPGTAFADTGPSVNTATSITSTHQWNYSWNVSTVRIDVSVTAQSGGSAAAGDVVVSAGPARDQSCAAELDQSSGLTSTGYCYLKYLADGWYKLTASYGGQAAFGSSVSVENPFAVGGAPAWKVASPPLSARPGTAYDYVFTAAGSPEPRYSLAPGAPGWLHIQGWNGEVYGQIPSWVHSFGYAVTARNSIGSATTKPFTVSVSAGRTQAHVSTQLNCPRYLVSGRSGWCTLVVSDSGPARASGVTARVYLPSQLRVRSCGPWCWVRGSTVSWQLGTVNPWQTKSVSVYVTARFSAPHWWQRSVRVSVGGAAYWNHSWWQNGASHTSTQVTILRRS